VIDSHSTILAARPNLFHLISLQILIFNTYHRESLFYMQRRSMSSHTVSSSGSEMEGGSISDDRQYYNSKLRRLDSLSFYDQVNSPSTIISSIYKDLNWTLTRDLVLSAIWFYIGAYSWKAYIAEHGWLRIRPIPYQVTQAGDVLLDLTLTNDLVEKLDQIFPCEL